MDLGRLRKLEQLAVMQNSLALNDLQILIAQRRNIEEKLTVLSQPIEVLPASNGSTESRNFELWLDWRVQKRLEMQRTVENLEVLISDARQAARQTVGRLDVIEKLASKTLLEQRKLAARRTG